MSKWPKISNWYILFKLSKICVHIICFVVYKLLACVSVCLCGGAWHMKANEPLIWSYLWPGSLLYLFLFVFSHYMTITEMFHSAGALLPDNLKVFRRPSCRFTSFLTLVIFLQCSQDWWAHYLWLSLFVFSMHWSSIYLACCQIQSQYRKRFSLIKISNSSQFNDLVIFCL